MKIYRLFSFLFMVSFLGLFTWQFSQLDLKNSELSPVLAEQKKISGNYQKPFNLVYQFYEAIEKNEWEKVKEIVTPIWWGEMHRSGYKQKWQEVIKNDASINFVMFLVSSQKVDTENNYAWVIGKADWVSSNQVMDDENVTVFLIKEKNEWKINSILINMPVETVEDFYETINEGKFHQISSYLSKELWKKLDRSEIIDVLKSDWKKNKSGVYCVFYLQDFGINGNQSWVKGDVTWNPLTAEVNETPVTIYLTNHNEKGWTIDKIVGHWEGEK